MTSNLIPFRNEEFELTVTPDGDSFRVHAPGLARALGFRDAYRLLEAIPEDEKGYTIACTPGGEQRIGYVTEAGFYRCLGQRQAARIKDDSIRDQVERFQGWVYGEVLPQIRRTGSYGTPKQLTDDEIVHQALQITANRVRELEAQIAADRPKVLFADAVSTSESTILVGDLAKILKGNGVEVGANRLFEWLRRDGYLIRRRGTDWNMPTQYAMKLGLFKVKETAITHADGHVTISKTPKVTGKGQEYLVNRYLSRAVMPV